MLAFDTTFGQQYKNVIHQIIAHKRQIVSNTYEYLILYFLLSTYNLRTNSCIIK